MASNPKGWWLNKIALHKWQLKYREEKTVFETFECGITAIQVRAMLNRYELNPRLGLRYVEETKNGVNPMLSLVNDL